MGPLTSLSITRMMEQHTLAVAIWGSSDGKNWRGRPLLVLPKRSYCGQYSHTVGNHSTVSFFVNANVVRPSDYHKAASHFSFVAQEMRYLSPSNPFARESANRVRILRT